jgi:hypothetical protein
MRRRVSLLPALLVALPTLLSWCATPARAAWPHDPSINLRVSANVPGANVGGSPVACPDGAGGFYTAWENYVIPGGNAQVYLQHVTLAGTIAPGWPAAGLAVASNPSSSQFSPAVCTDGAGGVFVAWGDGRNSGQGDIYAERVTGTGALAPSWPVGGLRITTDVTHTEYTPILASDGAGGAVLAWTLTFGGADIDTWMTSLGPSGATNVPFALSQSTNSEHAEDLAVDASGNVFIAFTYDSVAAASIRVVKLNHLLVPQWGGGFWQAYTSATGPSMATTRLCLDGRGSLFVIGAAGLIGQNGWFMNVAQVLGSAPIAMYPGGDTGQQFFLEDVVPDPDGGCYFSYEHGFYGFDSHVAHFRGDGIVPYPWTLATPAGIALDDGLGIAGGPGRICADGTNGVLVSFQGNEVFGTRIEENATFAPGWARTHTVLSNVARPQMQAMVPDGQGGGYALWADSRDAPGFTGIVELFAQHVDRFGALGDAAPHIVSIKDVPADQGGSVKLTWTASYLDSGATRQVSAYWIWREVPTSLALARIARGAHWADEAKVPLTGAARPGMLYRRGTTTASAAYAWEYLDSQPANTFPQYSYVAATVNDSMPGHTHYTRFMVEARDAGGLAFWDSTPDSGQSVDNIPPAVPNPFTAHYQSGVTALAWGPNHEGDLAGYRLYRGATAGFVPGPSNRISDQPDPGYSDVAPTGSWYKLSAYDIHGNESGYAVLGPTGITGVDGPALPTELALAITSGIPSRGPVGLRLALPNAASVRLEIYDTSGRRVRTLATGTYGAGFHDLAWDTRDDAGHALASGLFFARLVTPGRTLTRRIALVK